MTAYPIPNPFAAFNDLTGLPMTGGYIYIGLPNQDPETSPMAVYTDEGLTIPFAQPLRTIGGYLVHTGTPANAYPASTPYSIRVRNGLGIEIFYEPEVHDRLAEAIANLISNLAASSGSSLVGFIQSGAGAVARTVQDKLREPVQTVRDRGAATDGTTDARAAFVACDAIGPVVVPSGSYLIATNLTIANAISFAPGAKLVIPNGVTVTFNGTIEAGPFQIFQCTGTGAVAIDGRATPSGWGEWWGLVRENSGAAAANLTALNAALVALCNTRLLACSYYVSGEVNINLDGHSLIGGGAQGSNEGCRTRLVCTSATTHILYMGARTFTSIGALPRGILVKDILLDRSVGPDVPASAAGLLARYNLFSDIRNVKSLNSVNCFQFSGTVHLKGYDLHANRSIAGTGGTDRIRGYYIEGGTSIGANGGNASLYLYRCNAEGGIPIGDSIGFFADHKMTDLFLFEPETSNFTTAISISGDSSNGSYNNDTTDIQIDNPILDTFTFAGIYITGLNKYGSIEINGGYYGAAPGATAAINVVNNLSTVLIDGGEFLMGAQTSAFGVRVKDSSNVVIKDCLLDESTQAAVILDGASNCKVTPFVKNNSSICDAAVKVLGTITASYIAPMVSGSTNKVLYGIQIVGTGDNRNEYNCTGIDSTCINTGSGNKLVRNAVQITATGLSGTNLVSGVMT